MNDDDRMLLAQMRLDITRLIAEVVKLQEIVQGSPSLAEGWQSSKDAAIALKNEGVKSAAHLKRLRLEGAFNGKGEVRNVSKGDRPTWEYHVPNCRKALKRYFS